MAIRTGEQLLQPLRDGCQLFIDGDRAEDGDHRSCVSPQRRKASPSSATYSTARRSSTDIRSSFTIPRSLRGLQQ
jgi:hypothetical protein